MVMKKRYIGEKKPLGDRLRDLPYYSIECPAEASGLRRKRPLWSRIIWGKRDGDEHQI